MSHFTVMVIWDNPEKQLEKYDENIDYDPYVVRVVSDEEKTRLIEYYNKEKKLQHTVEDFDSIYERFWQDWNSGDYKKNEDWIWEEWSTYNPLSKRDWYQLWGRRTGMIELLEWKEWTYWSWSLVCANVPWIDQAKQWDIYNLKDLKPFAYVKDWVWSQKWEMWRWGMHTIEISESDWEKKMLEELQALPADTLISIYDCHI